MSATRARRRVNAPRARVYPALEVVELETADPALRGEMTITITLADADGGTEVLAVHDGLRRGLPPADNEEGWRQALAKLAELVESASLRASEWRAGPGP